MTTILILRFGLIKMGDLSFLRLLFVFVGMLMRFRRRPDQAQDDGQKGQSVPKPRQDREQEHLRESITSCCKYEQLLKLLKRLAF